MAQPSSVTGSIGTVFHTFSVAGTMQKIGVKSCNGDARSFFHQIKLAAQRTHCQWEMPLEDGYAMQLPHLATFRRMIFAMQLQIRLKIADGQTEQALEMLQDGFYMGRSIAQGPTVIQDLVGIAITAILFKEVEGLMQMPDSPNLYWALTALPDPMIDMHSSLEYEREILFVEFPQLRNLEKEVLTSAQAADFIKKIQALGGGMGDMPFKQWKVQWSAQLSPADGPV